MFTLYAYTIAKLLIAIFCTEAVTELIVHSAILEPFRNTLHRWSSVDSNGEFQGNFFSKLVSCGYCTSVWVAIYFVWLLGVAGSPRWYLVWTLIVHRGANYLNDFYDRYLREDLFAKANDMFQ